MAYLFENVEKEAESMTVDPLALQEYEERLKKERKIENIVDCSKTVNFHKEKNRMCRLYKLRSCEGCPFSPQQSKRHINCNGLVEHLTEYAVEILQKWSDEHPIHICPYCGNEIKN